VADIAFVARELRLPVENMAFEWVKLYKPTTIVVANAALDARRVASNLAVFVNPGNPLAGLTLAQLDGIFGAEHKRGGANLRTWGDAGLAGAWKDRPIRVIAPEVTSVPALFFRRAVLGDSLKWNPSIEEFASPEKALDAVAHDVSAIAYAPVWASSDARVKKVPIAGKIGEEFVPLAASTVADHRYPLSRVVIVAIDRPQGKPLDPKVREFLRYVLSAEGQAAVARDGAYVPLESADAARQAKRLD
jgi:phosphate transport system substrate-binding protein